MNDKTTNAGRPRSFDDDMCLRAYNYHRCFSLSYSRIAHVFGTTDKTIKQAIERGGQLIKKESGPFTRQPQYNPIAPADPATELIKLRAGVARIARRMGLAHDIPGATDSQGLLRSIGIEELCKKTAPDDPAWYRLCALILKGVDALTWNDPSPAEPPESPET